MSPVATPIIRLPVGVVIERRKADSPWIDFTWAPVSVLDGEPAAEPWSVLGSHGDTTSFYAGPATVELYRSETAYYRDNLASGQPSLWVVLAETGGEPPFTIQTVTADPAEGEGFAESAANMVEQVPMPQSLQAIVAAFVAEHHVEQVFYKRKRDRQNPESLARRGYGDHDE